MIMDTELIQDPTWLQMIERLGLPLALIVFGCAVVWKLMPHVIEWFKAGTATARSVAEAMPTVKDSLNRLANSAQVGEVHLAAIDKRTQEIESKADQILSKIEK